MSADGGVAKRSTSPDQAETKQHTGRFQRDAFCELLKSLAASLQRPPDLVNPGQVFVKENHVIPLRSGKTES